MKNLAYLFGVLALSTSVAFGQSKQPLTPKQSSYIPVSKPQTKGLADKFKDILLKKLTADRSECTVFVDGPTKFSSGPVRKNTFINNGKPNQPATEVCPFVEFFRVPIKAKCPDLDPRKIEFEWRAEMLMDDKDVCQVSKKTNGNLADSTPYKKNDIVKCCNLIYFMDMDNLTENNREVEWAAEKAKNFDDWEADND